MTAPDSTLKSTVKEKYGQAAKAANIRAE